MRNARWRTGFWRDALLLLLVQFVVFSPVLLGGGVLLPVADSAAPPWCEAPASSDGQDFAGTDRAVFCWPNWNRIRSALHGDAGDLLWNPDNLCGTPFLGTLDTVVAGCSTLLLWFFSVPTAALLSALLLGWAASLCARLALLRWLSDARAVLLGAAVFGTTPWLIAHQDVFNFVESAAWTPLLFYGADVVLRERRMVGVLALAAGFALSFFGGLPQLTLVASSAAGAFAVCTSIVQWRNAGLRSALVGLGLVMAGFLCGVLLALPLLLPGLTTAKSSARAAISSEDQRHAAMRPGELSGLLLPDLLGAPARLHAAAKDHELPADITEESFPLARMAGLPTHGASHLERICGAGAVGALCALVALLHWRDRRSRYAVALLTGGFLLAMATPLLDLVLLLPGFSFGSPRRWIFCCVLALTFLAALGCEFLLDNRRTRRLFPAALLCVSPVALLVILASVAPQQISALFEGPAAENMPAWILRVSVPVLLVLLIATALCFRMTGTRLCLALLLLLALDGAWLQHTLNPAQHDAVPFEATTTTEYLRRSAYEDCPVPGAPWRLARFRSPATDMPDALARPVPLPPNLNLLFGIPDVHGYEGMLHRRYEELLEVVEPGISVAHHLIREFRDINSLEHPVLDLLGARSVLSPGLLPLARVHTSVPELCAVYRNEGAQPLVQVPAALEVLADDNAVLHALDQPSFRPEQRAFVLPGDAAALGWASGATLGPPPHDLHFRVERRSTEIIIHYSNNPAPRPLLLAMVHHAEWEALDAAGATLPLVRADHALMATRLPAGSGTVRVVYCPRDFHLGLLGAAAGVLGLLVLAWGMRQTQRSRVAC